MWHFNWVKTCSDPAYIFSGGQNLPPHSRIYAPGEPPDLLTINRGEDSMWAVIYEDCRRRVTCTHVLEFCLGHDNLSPVEQQRHWLEDTVCLKLIRRKDGSVIRISKISEVIMFNCSSLMLWNLQLYNSFEWKNVTFQGVKTYSDLPTYFQGVRTSTPHDLRPCFDYLWITAVVDRITKFLSTSEMFDRP